LKYQGLTVNAVDADLVKQLQLTAEMVCSTFHVPAFKIGAGTIPAGQKVEDLNQIYYTDCLQSLMESAEALLDEGLGLDEKKEGKQLGVEFSLDDLLKMDSATMTSVLAEQVGAGITKPNEARRRLNYEPATGGESVYLQQQNYSLEALAERDKGADPFGTAKPPAAPVPPPAKDFAAAFTKALTARFQEATCG
jgi:phage portal protein BeeE